MKLWNIFSTKRHCVLTDKWWVKNIRLLNFLVKLLTRIFHFPKVGKRDWNHVYLSRRCMYKNNIFDDINIAHFNYKLFFFCRVFLNAPLNILQRPKHQPHPKSVIRQLNDITIRLRQQIERRERHNKSKYKPYGFRK